MGVEFVFIAVACHVVEVVSAVYVLWVGIRQLVLQVVMGLGGFKRFSYLGGGRPWIVVSFYLLRGESKVTEEVSQPQDDASLRKTEQR